MRIEPTTNSLPRQSLNRRHREEVLHPKNTRDQGVFGRQDSLPISTVSTRVSQGSDIVSLNTSDHKTLPRLGSGRWRSYVPFIAQYIGQEMAIETPERTTRRHSESARKSYHKQDTLTPLPRTVARV